MNYLKNIKIVFFFCSIAIFNLLTPTNILLGQTKRALIIGINEYVPKGTRSLWSNLDGAVNDAKAINSVIKAKYGFKEENISLLIKPELTKRDGIIQALDNLISQSQEGDIVFFYYAGHGTQVPNSQYTSEIDRKHEAIVPSNGPRNEDYYILDYELNKKLSDIIDKGAKLSVIIDGCHSGSLTRSALKSRLGPPCTTDINRKVPAEIDLTKKGAVILSATKDHEEAKEFPGSKKHKGHGVFTYVLLKAMQQSAPNEPVSHLFKRAYSYMRHHSIFSQHPVMESSLDREKEPLFGESNDDSAFKKVVSVVNAQDPRRIELDGGLVVGLREGCTLSQKHQDGSKTILKINEVESLTRSYAQIEQKGNGEINTGSLFEIESWVVNTEPMLKLYVPKTDLTESDIKAISTSAFSLRQKDVAVYSKPTNKASAILYFENDQWKVFNYYSKKESIIKNPLDTNDLYTKLNASYKEGNQDIKEISLYVELPVIATLADSLKKHFPTNSVITVVDDISQANYKLFGHVKSQRLYYAWTSTEYTEEEEDIAHPIPATTKSIFFRKNGSYTKKALANLATKIENVKKWLTLESPPNSDFPYRVALKDINTQELRYKGTLNIEHRYQIALTITDKELEKLNREGYEDPYIYVFAIDSKGGSALLYPSLERNIENNLNQVALKDGFYQKEAIIKTIPEQIRIKPPYGIETLIMLTSDSPINDVSIFNKSGFRAIDPGKGVDIENNKEMKAFEKMINSIDAGLITPEDKTVSKWSIQKFTFSTLPPKHDK